MRPLLMIGCCTLLFLGDASVADGQQAVNPIGSLVGHWDLPGTPIRLKIHPDGTVDHSSLGEGTIRFDETSYYRLVFRQRHLTCQYDVRKYSENELTFTVSVQPSDSLCELGALRRSPGSPLPENKGKSSETPAAGAVASAERPLRPGISFKDCDDCPDMMVLPTGRFTMGSPVSEVGRRPTEGPQRTIEVGSSIAVGRYAVTRDQYDTFVKATGHLYKDGCRVEAGNEWDLRQELSFRKVNFQQDGRHPVVCVSWDDARAYAIWLSSKTGKSYRLLTEAEREYASRAGTSTPFWWGDTVRPELANYYKDVAQPIGTRVNQGVAASGVTRKSAEVQIVAAASPEGTVPVHLYQPNPWGIFQVHGNVAEWVEDCWTNNYVGAPANTSAVKTGNCERRVLRGGSWNYRASDIRSAYRESAPKDERYVHVGFRVARELN